MVLVLPLGFCNLDENIIVQIIAFIGMVFGVLFGTLGPLKVSTWCRRNIHFHLFDPPKAGPQKTGTIFGITVEEINDILEMAPNADDDLEKVVNSWSFNAFPDDDKPGWYRCAIWDYKGSHHSGYFSTYGEPDVFKFLFGDRYEELYA